MMASGDKSSAMVKEVRRLKKPGTLGLNRLFMTIPLNVSCGLCSIRNVACDLVEKISELAASFSQSGHLRG
jgi:hypothetical protein